MSQAQTFHTDCMTVSHCAGVLNVYTTQPHASARLITPLSSVPFALPLTVTAERRRHKRHVHHTTDWSLECDGRTLQLHVHDPWTSVTFNDQCVHSVPPVSPRVLSWFLIVWLVVLYLGWQWTAS